MSTRGADHIPRSLAENLFWRDRFAELEAKEYPGLGDRDRGGSSWLPDRRIRSVPLTMSRTGPERLDSRAADPSWAADVLVREETDEEEEDDEEEGDDDDDNDEDGDEGYSE